MLPCMARTGTDDLHAPGGPELCGPMPQVDLRHVLSMTDCTGMFQHAVYSLPDLKHGYCIDDNARALIAAVGHAQLFGGDQTALPLRRYLTFLAYAYNEGRGRFRNFMSYDRRWLEDVGSPDSQGRTIWALGVTVSNSPDEDVRDLANDLFINALPGVSGFIDLRSKTFAIIGLEHYLKQYPDNTDASTNGSAPAAALRDRYALDLLTAFTQHGSDGWPWCEDLVTYDNAKTCHALLVAGESMGRADMVDQGLKSLAWLLDVQSSTKGYLSIIGNAGWLPRGGQKADFDQQPLEAHALVHACLTAARVSADKAWINHAWQCFRWFTGENDQGVALYDPDTGGCMDGLNPEGANRNQGAESTLAYLLSVLELHRYHDTPA
jgi:hypothetical protein